MKKDDKQELRAEEAIPFQRFHDLMRHRTHEVLLVSSLYDFFILSEDGGLYETVFAEYLGMGLTHVPGITRISSAREALQMVQESDRFDVIITSLHPKDMHACDFARELKKLGTHAPVVLLTWDNKDFSKLIADDDTDAFDKVFVWQGDCRIFIAIIKYFEDRLNIEEDTQLAGVQSIILIEDNIRFYSSFLPVIYEELLQHTKKLISEGVNQAHRRLRMRARPKIILCETFEEAWRFFEKYRRNILGVISDIEFPRNGELDDDAGFEFTRMVKATDVDFPVLFQSSDEENRSKAEELGASFLRKDSDHLLHDLRSFLVDNLGFGDFVFRLQDGTVVSRASDLRSFEEQLQVVPSDSIAYHASREHFSKWFKARTEHPLAMKFKAMELSHFETTKELTRAFVSAIQESRKEQHRGTIVDFEAETFDSERTFARIGGGSLGGKARGLGFANSLLNIYAVRDRFPSVKVSVPSSVVLGADIFDQFITRNNLRTFALHATDDEEILSRFLEAKFPAMVTRALEAFLEKARYPLSVRSSSLLEDAQYVPFAGIYKTLMVPNNHTDPKHRLKDLIDAVKRVYASTFFQAAKTYMRATPYRREEEKMAVIIQRLVGALREERFYPDFSGVARSYNYYPVAPMKPEDGIALVALGLGKTVVEGGTALRFCPKYPRHLVQFSTVEDILEYSQVDFFAMKIPDPNTEDPTPSADPYRYFWGKTSEADPGRELKLICQDLEVAERDGVLDAIGSTYSPENHTIYDGIDREGIRIVTFGPVLKYGSFPLPEILDLLLELGEHGMNGPVEIEFAVNLAVPPGKPKEFHLLQMRPMVIDQEFEQLGRVDVNWEDVVCQSTRVLGNGMITDIHDVVVVDINKYNRASSREVAKEVAKFNNHLFEDSRPYVLIGVGRWGSADPWLGIPVRWEEISGAKVIVESEMKDLKVLPSQGTHFFQNLTSAKVGYFTVRTQTETNFVNWDLLSSWAAFSEAKYTRHLRFEKPLTVIMDGHEGRGIIAKQD